MRRYAILLGLGLACAPAAQAQPEAQLSGSFSIEALVRDPLTKRDHPDLVRRLEEIQDFTGRVGKDFAPSELPGATAGFKVTFDERGKPVLVRVPTAKSSEIIITDDALEQVRTLEGQGLRDLMKDLAEQRGTTLFRDDSAKSVDPWSTDWTPQLLPAAWKGRATSVGWTGAAGTFPTGCPESRDKFSSGPEKNLLGEEMDPTRALQEPDRASWIAAIKAYEAACLSKVAPGALPTSGPPLGSVAVLQSTTPFCMATHLGGDLFLTARHCYFGKEGTRLRGHEKFTVSLINGSASNVPVVLAANQPIPSTMAAMAAHDIVLLQAPTLAPAVKTLAGPKLLASTDLPKVMISEAYVLGYFALANPDGVLGKPDGTVGRLPAWNEALRTTTKVGLGYCRAWDYTAPGADGAACIQHSCQTMKGFSGAPVFVRRDEGVWQLAGVHVANGEVAQLSCGAFKSGEAGGLLRRKGGLAAALPKTLTVAAATVGSGTALGR